MVTSKIIISMNIPEGHQGMMPYLCLDKASNFIEFAQNVFQSRLKHKSLREDELTIKHAEIQISGCTLMFSEANEQWNVQTAHLFVYVESADETYQKALEHGASSLIELSDQDYGRTCGVTDPFGNVWWITSIHN